MKLDFKSPPKYCWRPWFAWRPVLTRERNGRRSLVWLIPVERYQTWIGSDYRLVGE